MAHRAGSYVTTKKLITVTKEVYARLLRDKLPQIYQPKQAWFQDNAPVHNARVAKAVLKKLGVWSLLHPLVSFDFNPIEHLWFVIKELIHLRHPELMTMEGGKKKKKQALKQAIQEAFAEFIVDNEWDLLTRLLTSMPARLDAVKLVCGK